MLCNNPEEHVSQLLHIICGEESNTNTENWWNNNDEKESM